MRPWHRWDWRQRAAAVLAGLVALAAVAAWWPFDEGEALYVTVEQRVVEAGENALLFETVPHCPPVWGEAPNGTLYVETQLGAFPPPRGVLTRHAHDARDADAEAWLVARGATFFDPAGGNATIPRAVGTGPALLSVQFEDGRALVNGTWVDPGENGSLAISYIDHGVNVTERLVVRNHGWVPIEGRYPDPCE